MALPAQLQNSMSPAELELVASEQLVDIVPLVSMERTAFISVSIFNTIGDFSKPRLISKLKSSGRIRTVASTRQKPCSNLDGS